MVEKELDTITDHEGSTWAMEEMRSSTDLDFSFTSTSTTTTTSARTSLARSSITLSFNDRLSNANAADHSHHCPQLPHRRSDPQWSAIRAASNLSSSGSLHLRHLKLLRHLGTGNLGRVFLCRLRDSSSDDSAALFALKVVDNDALSPKKLSHAKTEADVLASLDHPFLPTLYARIHVSHYTCLLIDYCPGGDLHSLLNLRRQSISLDAVRFLAAEVLLALEYLHSLGIVYRDLKPENILLRADGHIMLSDFDLCFKADIVPRLVPTEPSSPSSSVPSCCFIGRPASSSSINIMELVAEPTGAWSRSCVGTHEYLAPELVAGTGHGSGVDWWAFGVLVYELMYGTTPFKGTTKEATLRNIAASGKMRFPRDEAAGHQRGMAHDLIEKLLVKDPRRRLGVAMGAADIKRHPFFKGIKWALIRNYTPPEELIQTQSRPRSWRNRLLAYAKNKPAFSYHL